MAKIYLDYAATTPCDPKVLRAMMPYFKKDFGNPSSIHSFGQKALGAIDEARQKVAKFLGCSPREIVFTGSATEADNLAIQGLAKKGHIITTKIEHHAVLEPCQVLEKKGAEVTYLPVDKEGLVKVSDVEKALRPDTLLVSVMYANNEIGAVQPIAEIGKLLKTQKNKIYFHTDAVQAANFLECDVEKLGVDLLSLSGHKIYGPKGVGILYIKKGTPLQPLIFGGGHEQGFRSGTENVAGIVGFGQAVEEVQNPRIKIQNIKIRQLRDRIIKKVLKLIPNVKLNGPLPGLSGGRLPNNINFSFEGAEGEAMVIALDQKGIASSTGSACSSKSLEPSHVLLALGLSDIEAHTSLRVSLGRHTTEKEVERFLKVLPPVIQKLRKISGYTK